MTSSGPIPLALLGGLLLSACSSMEDAGYGGAGGGGGQGGSGGVGGFHDIPLEVSAVAVGASHSCAVTVNGGVACWGSGARGQLGDGISGKDYHRAMAAPVVGISGAVGVRAGGDTTCAVLYGGGVWCWGEGAFGQLGDGVAADGLRCARRRHRALLGAQLAGRVAGVRLGRVWALRGLHRRWRADADDLPV